MFYLSELYSPKPSWTALSHSERIDFFEKIKTGMTALSDAGIEAIAMGEVNARKKHSAPQRFFAIWKFPTETSLDALIEGIAATGWHDYFDTVNACGKGTDMAAHLEQLATL